MRPIKLRLQKKIEVTPSAPFDFDSTFHKPDHFTSGDNIWEPGVKWQTWYFGGYQLGLKFENKGLIDIPKLFISVYADSWLDDKFLTFLTDEIRYRYNLDLDLTPFYKAFRKDKILGPVIERFRGMRPGHPSSLYEYLIIGIILQNATVRRSIQMFQTLLENFGTYVEFAGKKLWCCWEPGGLSEVSEEELRALKLGYRAKAIKGIDNQFAQGLIDELKLRKEGREEQMRQLLRLYGVGPATAWYLLFDVFHNWDFFNHVSPWEQKIYSKLFFDADPENPVEAGKILEYFEGFGDFKQLAVHYIWEDLWWKRKNGNIPWLEKLLSKGAPH